MAIATQTQATAAAAADATVRASIVEASRPARGAPQLAAPGHVARRLPDVRRRAAHRERRRPRDLWFVVQNQKLSVPREGSAPAVAPGP
eukprot:4702465-Prymnesium_polylepis.1